VLKFTQRHPVRAVEWVLAAYFSYTSLLSLILPAAEDVRVRTLLVNACVFAIFAYLIRESRHDWAVIARDWGTLALALLGYREMGWFAPGVHYYTLEQSWVLWDRMILGQFGLKRLIEIAGPVIPFMLELSYLLVYAVAPFSLAMIYVFRRREAAEIFLLFYILGLYLSYMQFPFWPSEPPRTVFPGDQAPVPNFVRDWNLAIVGGAGIHTSVFPSAHVSGAFASAFAVWRIFADVAWMRRGILAYACVVTVATVYGRYHYAADAFAGMAVGVAAVWLAKLLLPPSRDHSRNR
jgi:membrane-associated phospholipid phosphatase